MNYFLFIITFCIVLFIYIHINYQLSTSNDLEIFELESPWSKEILDNICYNKQPIKFNFSNDEILKNINLSFIEQQYNAFDIKIRNIKDDKDNKLHLPFSVGEISKLFENDTESTYITENNEDFLNETALIKIFKHNDNNLRPPWVSNCKYDFISGTKNSIIPLQYKISYRNFIMVTEGSVNLKLISPDYTKYLHLDKDYENFYFYSPINCWDTQKEYQIDYNKVKSLEITLQQGDIVYIPSYWWYSIKFNQISSLSTFYYSTYANTISILPDLFINFLQNQNIKHKMNNIIETT
jgi:hypothetical protein